MTVWTTGTSTSSANDTVYGWRSYRVVVSRPVPVPRCLHALFDLPCDAPKAELRSAYRRLAKIAHPDNGGDGRWMVVLNRVYEALEKAA